MFPGWDERKMKYFLQVFFSAVVPLALFILAGNTQAGKITLGDVNIFLKHCEIVAFAVVGITSLFGYAYLIGQEVQGRNRICFTMAQIICLLTTVISFAYAYTIHKWIQIAGGGYTTGAIETIDIFYSLIDLLSAMNKMLVIQFIFVVLFRRWIIPLDIRLRATKPIGEILIQKGYLTEEQLNEAIKEQDKLHTKKGE